VNDRHWGRMFCLISRSMLPSWPGVCGMPVPGTGRLAPARSETGTLSKTCASDDNLFLCGAMLAFMAYDNHSGEPHVHLNCIHWQPRLLKTTL
jgi:hypothetical protein